MKLSEWAKKQSISYRTAWNMFKFNKLPSNISAKQLPTGTIVIEELQNEYCSKCGQRINK